MGTGPHHNLRGPHGAHSRSREQPRGTGEPPGEAEVEVGCGSRQVQGHLQRRPQGNIVITINFIMF